MNILLACPRILFRCLLVEPLPALAGRAVAIDGGCKVLKRILSCTLMVAFGLFAPLWASPVSAGSADSLNLLADPRYWEAVTPEQARALIAGRSLAGMRSEKKYAGDKDALTPLMAAAWRTPYPEIIDLLVKAGGEVDATTGKSVSYSVPGTPNPGLHAHTESIVTALHFAVLNPKPAVLRALLRHRPDLDIRGGDSCSALELAAKRAERTEHMRLLLEAGARPLPFTGEHAPSHYSIWRFFLGFDTGNGGYYRDKSPVPAEPYIYGILLSAQEAAAKTRLLLARGVRPDADALARALAAGHNEAARLLLDAGANPAETIEGWSMLEYALYRPRPKDTLESWTGIRNASPPDPVLIKRLIPAAGSLKGKLLIRACESGLSAKIVAMLVEAGAPYSTQGNGLMFAALQSPRDCDDLVAYLLQLGFSPADRGGGGLSPLRAAAKYPVQKPRSALTLVKAGVPADDLEDIQHNLNRKFAVKAGICDKAGRLLVKGPGAGAERHAFAGKKARGQDEAREEVIQERELQRLVKEKARIMELARDDLENALYWRTFYAVATPDEVREIIGGRTLRIKTVKGKTSAYRHPMDALEALPYALFDKAFWTGYRTVKSQYSPLVEAAGITPYPEVIHMLIQAGCKVTDMNSEALLQAIRNPNPAVLEAVLSYQPSLKSEIFYLGSPLHYLAGTDPATFRKEHFRLLLQAGADPNAQSGQDRETPLMRAAFYRNTEAGRMLLAAGARTDIVNRVGDYALGIAVGREAYDLARDIQRAGSPVQGTYDAPLKALAENSNADAALARDLVVAVGPESAEAAEAVQLAARRGNLAALRSLLDAGARGPDKRITMNGALLAAVTESPNDAKTPADKPEIVALLLKHGADAGMRFRSLGAAAARERWIFLFFHNGAMDESLSALHLAADYGLPRTVALLIKAGAPVDMIDNEGRTPLWLAASYGSPWEDAYNLGRPERMTACAEAAKLLAAAGADPIREDREGFSPLLMGLSNPQIVSLFLKSPKVRTRVDAVTGSGWTALTHAAFHERRTEAIPLLLAAGADPGRPDGEGRLALDVALEKKNGKAAAYLMAGRSTGTGKGKPGAP